MSKQSVVGLAKSILEPVEQVKMAFLFGSRATARARSDSDVDIAVYWEPRPSRRQRERVWEGLEKALGTEVDLVDLNDCPATLAWEALQGIPLIKRDERFHQSTCSRFPAKRKTGRNTSSTCGGGAGAWQDSKT